MFQITGKKNPSSKDNIAERDSAAFIFNSCTGKVYSYACLLFLSMLLELFVVCIVVQTQWYWLQCRSG